MKWTFPLFAAIVLASCDQRETAVSTLDPAPVLRENAELKKKVAALEKEKQDLVGELEHAKDIQTRLAKSAAKEWLAKDKLERAAAKAPN